MKQVPVLKLTVTACCVAINVVGAFIALTLRLPIYLDSIGTIMAGALLGPAYGMAAGCLGGLASGVSFDIYSIYFMPDGIVTGLMAGLLFRTVWMKKVRLLLGTLFLTVPGTIISACIAAYIFGGVTSSGSSLIVQVLWHMGLSLVASAFVVQFMTDYLDRLVAVLIVSVAVSRLGSQFKLRLQGGKAHGTV